LLEVCYEGKWNVVKQKDEEEINFGFRNRGLEEWMLRSANVGDQRRYRFTVMDVKVYCSFEFCNRKQKKS
jgi:hypothetical protein